MKNHESSLMFALLFLILAEHMKGYLAIGANIVVVLYGLVSVLEVYIYMKYPPKEKE